MANRWYNNGTNIIVDFTRANAADVENKLNDVVAGFDALQIEFDQEKSDVDDDISETVRLTQDNGAGLISTLTGAQRAEGVMGFDENGDFEVKTLSSEVTLTDTYTVVNGTGTLSVMTSYYVQCNTGYTLTLPTPTQAGQMIGFVFDDDAELNNVTLDGNGTNINGDSTLVVDCNNAQFRLVFDGTEWGL